MREPIQQLEGAICSACHPTCTRVVHGQVATRRTRTAGKVEIPNVDDHVSKLEHMGKETVKKLQDIRGSAVQCGIDISVPDNCIVKGARPACAWCGYRAGVLQQMRLPLAPEVQVMCSKACRALDELARSSDRVWIRCKSCCVGRL